MYLPYLRGRQFELLALRELVEKNLIGEKIIPVIEPIKPTSTLSKTLEVFSKNKKNIALIMNPNVGAFNLELKKIKNNPKNEVLFTQLSKAINNKYVIKSFIITHGIERRLNTLESKEDLLIINNEVDQINEYLSIYDETIPRFTLTPGGRTFRRAISGNKVLFEDRFNKLDRNADYINEEDEFFSDDHLFYDEEGYKGFSDYSVVGEAFNDAGFAPFAIAIHIVYFDRKKNLRIRHFVSDSNDDINDPAGKFGEALEKLINWVETNNITKTEALKEFDHYYNNGKYPGLGTVKKLSIMHHIEIVSTYLEGR